MVQFLENDLGLLVTQVTIAALNVLVSLRSIFLRFFRPFEAFSLFGGAKIAASATLMGGVGRGRGGWREKETLARKPHDFENRLRVVSNFGDGHCGAGEIHTRAHAKFRGDATRRERRKSLRVASPRNFSRARVCISRAPQSPSPKLETTRSLF